MISVTVTSLGIGLLSVFEGHRGKTFKASSVTKSGTDDRIVSTDLFVNEEQKTGRNVITVYQSGVWQTSRL